MAGWSENYENYLTDFQQQDIPDEDISDVIQQININCENGTRDVNPREDNPEAATATEAATAATDEISHCIKCNNTNIIIDQGYVICKDCGECNEFIFDAGVEWRYYPGQDSKGVDPSRCGIPANKGVEDLSYGTSISKGSSYKSARKFKIIQQHIYISNDKYKSRTLLKTYEDMYNKSIKIGIPVNVLEDAKIIYSHVRDIKISRGINKEAIIIISLFIACNISGHFANIKEFSAAFNIKQAIMTSARKIIYIISNHLKKIDIINKIKVQNPLDFIPKYCSLLDLDKKTQQLVKILVLKLMQLPDISENTPPAITAGTILLVANLYNFKINKKDISLITDISEVTIIKCYKKIMKWKEKMQDELFSKKIIKYFNIKL